MKRKSPELDHHTVMALDVPTSFDLVSGRETQTQAHIVGILQQDGHLLDS